VTAATASDALEPAGGVLGASTAGQRRGGPQPARPDARCRAHSRSCSGHRRPAAWSSSTGARKHVRANSRELATRIGRRVLPELSKAFAYRASRFEGFKIACYQASDRGFFGAHRDNLSPATAHRRFALTLNLNDGYQGGQLRFPEYGPERYRPAAGAALVFSCSHLHEVLDVTAGRRFVLLSFLFGEEAPHPE
jgi:predicted 2-oxoglutarate/Fe(II)-dependent dioxygenase YbiX